jgi:hypothetical protein
MHFPTDVLGGLILGGLWLWAVWRWQPAASRWLRGLSLAQQIGLAAAVALLYAAVMAGLLSVLAGTPDPAEWEPNAAAALALAPDEPAIDARSGEHPAQSAGLLFGLGVGLACAARWARFDARGPWLKRLARYLIGAAGVLLAWRGLALLFPAEPLAVALAFRFLRYSLIAFWALFLAPWLFLRLGLAEPRVMPGSRARRRMARARAH